MGSTEIDNTVNVDNVKMNVDIVTDHVNADNGVGAKSSNFELNGNSVTNVKMNGENYPIWANVMRVFLTANKKLKLVQDDPLPETDEKYEDWEIQNSIVMTWLWNSIEPSIAVKFMHLVTAKEIWCSVKEIYGQVGNARGVHKVFEKLFSVKKGDKSVVEYYSVLKAMWEELQVYHPLTTDLRALKRQRDEFQTALFLCGLGPEYASVKDEILACETLPSLAVAFSLCATDGTRTSVSTCSRPDSHGGRGDGSSAGDNHGSDLKCANCGKFGHNEQVCWDKSGKSASSERRCTYCGKSGHTEETCWGKLPKPVQAHLTIGGRGLGLWCSYCGASGHTEVTCWAKLGKLGWAPQVSGGPGVGLRCSYCGLTGHSEASCYYKLVLPAAGGSHFGLWCSYCSMSGHAEVSCCYKLGKPALPHQAAGANRPVSRCSHCGLSGHSEASCWDKLGKPAGFQPVQTVSQSIPEKTIQSNISGQSTSYFAREVIQSSPDKVPTSHSNTTIPTVGIAQSSTSWAIDSGAGPHNAGSRDEKRDWFRA